MQFADLITQVEDFHGTLFRNIKGIRVSQALFDDLAESDAELQAAMTAESASRMASEAPLLTRPFDYGAVVTWPFVPHNWQATRFSDGLHYGVWYGSPDIETTVNETAYHWHRFVMDSFASENRSIVGERRIFRARCDAILVDLRAKPGSAPGLVSRTSYAFSQQLGRYLHDQDQNGVLTPSARCAGINAAIFRPARLAAPREDCFLSYTLNPTEDQLRVRRGRKHWFALQPSMLY